MTAGDVLLDARYAIKDTGKAQFSDAQLLNALDAVQLEAASALSGTGSKVLLTSATLDTSTGSASLPTDYGYIDQAYAGDALYGDRVEEAHPSTEPGAYTYRVIGSTLYTGASSVTLSYFKTPTAVTAVTDTLVWPTCARPALKDMLVGYLAGDSDKLEQGKALLRRTLARRERRGHSARMPFNLDN